MRCVVCERKGRQNVHTQQLNWSKEKILEYLKQLDAEKKAKRAEYKANGKTLQKVRFKPSDSAARRERIEHIMNSADTLKYRAVTRSKVPTYIERNDNKITLRRVESAVNNIYISDNVVMKPKKFHEVDKKLTEIYDMMGITNAENKPVTYLVSNVEMNGKKVIAAAYNGAENVLFVNSDLAVYSKEDAPDLLKAFVCYTDDRSTYIHELYHWKDAEEYRQKFGAIDPNDPSAYNKYVDDMCRKRLDKVSKKGYNVMEISKYARDNLYAENFSEVYTEYRTKKLLKGE